MLTKEEIIKLTTIRNELYLSIEFLKNKLNNMSSLNVTSIDKLSSVISNINFEIQEQNHKTFKEENYIEYIKEVN